jgi:DEAD/DEAH box helicase domain-containing protein
MTLEEYYSENGWEIVYKKDLPGKEAEYFDCDDLNIKDEVKKIIKTLYPKGVYKHQKTAIDLSSKGENVCLTTSTASGKSLTFHISAINKLLEKPNSKIMAIYFH